MIFLLAAIIVLIFTSYFCLRQCQSQPNKELGFALGAVFSAFLAVIFLVIAAARIIAA